MKVSLPLLGITMGDPVGVGPEIIPKALSNPRVLRCCRPVVYGDATRLRVGAASSGVRLKFSEKSSLSDVRVGHDSIPVINPAGMDTEWCEWAQPTPISGMAMAAYLEAFRNPDTIRATCDDYRAGYGIDCDIDAADRDAGNPRRISQENARGTILRSGRPRRQPRFRGIHLR